MARKDWRVVKINDSLREYFPDWARWAVADGIFYKAFPNEETARFFAQYACCLLEDLEEDLIFGCLMEA